MRLDHALKINRADHVHVVKNEWFILARGIAEKKGSGFLQAAAGIQQDVFTRDLDPHSEISICLKIAGNLIGEVMDVDDDVANTERPQALQGDFQHGAA